MVLNLLLIGLAIAFDPLPLTGFMVVLPSERGVDVRVAGVPGDRGHGHGPRYR